MDIVGTVASVIQLLNNAITAFRKIRDLPSRVKEQGKVLTELLYITKEVRTNHYLQTEPICALLRHVSDTVESIQRQLPVSASKNSKIAKYWQSVKYTFRESDVLASLAALEPTKSSLLICINTEQMKYAGRNLGNTEDIRAKVNQIHSNMLEDDLATRTASTLSTSGIASTESTTSTPTTPQSPITYSWSGQRAMDNSRQLNGNIGFESFFASDVRYSDIESSGSAHQMNGSVSPGPAQGSGWEPRKVAWTGIAARGNSSQFNGDVCDPEGSFRWPM